MNVNIQAGDYGTVIRRRFLDVDRNPINISTATLKTVTFRAPDGTVFTRNMAFTTTGADGYVQYTTVSGDINIPGAWQRQFRVVYGSIDLKSPRENFQVGERIT